MTDVGPAHDEALPGGAFDALSNVELTALYLKTRRDYRALVVRAERMSRASGGIPSTGNRMYWGSVLFTRIVVTAMSVGRLLPDPKPREHWDFSAVASLTRNLLEAGLVYHWLCAAGIADEVRQGRFILLYLHDHGSRRRLLEKGEVDDDPVHVDLVRQFDANPYLASLGEKQRKVALRGEKTPFIQDDVLASMGEDTESFRLMYRFFSQHTHTGPISFYRMSEHVRGTGVETRHEKKYMIFAIEAASEALRRAIEEHLLIFSDAETRTPSLTIQQIATNVERDQGRARGRSSGS